MLTAAPASPNKSSQPWSRKVPNSALEGLLFARRLPLLTYEIKQIDSDMGRLLDAGTSLFKSSFRVSGALSIVNDLTSFYASLGSEILDLPHATLKFPIQQLIEPHSSSRANTSRCSYYGSYQAIRDGNAAVLILSALVLLLDHCVVSTASHRAIVTTFMSHH
jgi:hypothetical protein